MVSWIYCKCGKIIDEFEDKCHWCGHPLSEKEKDWNDDQQSPERQLELF